jgi:hypothetical protein
MNNLIKPYTEKQRLDFIVENNHNKGLTIQETDIALYALEPWESLDGDIVLNNKEEWEKEQLQILKNDKNKENAMKAKLAIENGFVEFKGAEFETNAQTVGDLTATMLILQAISGNSTKWLSKDDKEIELTIDDISTLGGLIAEFKNNVWNGKYLEYKELIENASNKDEVEKIEIIY